MRAVGAAGLALVGLVGAAALAACVVEDPPPSTMCFDALDCDSGEICGEDHVCYGNPPPGTFAAVVTPPDDRTDLAPAELEITFDQSKYGDFAAPLPALVKVSGRVVLADAADVSVKAKLVFRRPSRIPGAPDVVVTVSSAPGMPPGTPSYQAVLTPSETGERWRVTIFPDDGKIDGSDVSPAELAPPYRQDGFEFAGDVVGLDFPLGGNGPLGSNTIAGRLVDAGGLPVAGYRVLAFGRFGPLDRPELASSRGTTGPDGSFAITVPVPWEDVFDLELSPPADSGLPSITLRELFIEDPATPLPGGLVVDVGDVALPALPAAVKIDTFVEGRAPGGGTEPVVGARVVARSVVFDDGKLLVSYRAEGFLDGEGKVRLLLLPGTAVLPRAYAIDVIPPPSAPQATVLDVPVEVGAGGTGAMLTLPEPLPARVLLSGTLRDASGLPQGGVSVRIEPSALFLEELAERTLPLAVSDVQWPRGITDGTGHFGLWVDPALDLVGARYRVLFEPAEQSLLPRMVVDELIIAPEATSNSQDLGDQWLPDAAYVRGTVKGPIGDAVEGALLQIYEIVTPKACPAGAGEPCPQRSELRAQAKSGEAGAVRLVLPRPPAP